MSVNIETQDYIKQKEIQRQRQNQNNNNDFVTYAIAAIIVFFILFSLIKQDCINKENNTC